MTYHGGAVPGQAGRALPHSNPRASSGPKLNSIVTGDALKILKRIPSDTKFDVVIADPPYNIGKDFGNNSDSMPISHYADWASDWIQQCFRLLRGGGLYMPMASMKFLPISRFGIPLMGSAG